MPNSAAKKTVFVFLHRTALSEKLDGGCTLVLGIR